MSSRPRTTRRAPHIYPDVSGDGFQYHSSQLTFSDEWYCPQTMRPEDVGSTPGLSHSHRRALTHTYIHIYLSIYMHIHIYLPAGCPPCVSRTSVAVSSRGLYIYIYTSISIYLYIYLSIYLSINKHIYVDMHVYIYISPSEHLSAGCPSCVPRTCVAVAPYLFLYLSICISISLYVERDTYR